MANPQEHTQTTATNWKYSSKPYYEPRRHEALLEFPERAFERPDCALLHVAIMQPNAAKRSGMPKTDDMGRRRGGLEMVRATKENQTGHHWELECNHESQYIYAQNPIGTNRDQWFAMDFHIGCHRCLWVSQRHGF